MVLKESMLEVAFNLQIFVKSLYQKSNYEIKEFGDVLIAYNRQPQFQFNFILDFAEVPTHLTLQYEKNWEEALAYASSKRHAFIVVQSIDSVKESSAVNQKYGFNKIGQVHCVSIDHQQYANLNTTLPGYTIKRVSNEQELKSWTETLESSFNMIPGAAFNVYKTASEYLFSDNTQHLFFAAYNDSGEPVSVACLYLPDLQDVPAGHYCWGTKAEYRNKSVMSFLASNMVRISHEFGFTHSIANCLDASFGLAKKIGFEKVGCLNLLSNTKL